MKCLRTLVLFDQGQGMASDDWKTIHTSYIAAIGSIDHIQASGTLTLRRKIKTLEGTCLRNGVVYLRSRFLDYMLHTQGWQAEGIVNLARDRDQPPINLYPSGDSYREPITSDFGGFDFVTIAQGGTRIAIEWETGNMWGDGPFRANWCALQENVQ